MLQRQIQPSLTAHTFYLYPGDFAELQRAAKLSSAAYAACQGTAFDVTITKQINNAITDTQVSIIYTQSFPT